MNGTQNGLENHVEMLNAKSSKKFNAHKLLGMKRAEVNYVLWGQSTEGAAVCDPLIDKEMEDWKAVPSNKTKVDDDGKVYGQQRLKVEVRTRKEQFEKLPGDVKEKFTQKAKSEVNLSTEEDM